LGVLPIIGQGRSTMSGFMDKAKDVLDQHDEQVDQGLEKVGEQVDQRTGNTYTEQIDEAVDQAQQHTGEGDQVP
jgi:hypothetical protein